MEASHIQGISAGEQKYYFLKDLVTFSGFFFACLRHIFIVSASLFLFLCSSFSFPLFLSPSNLSPKISFPPLPFICLLKTLASLPFLVFREFKTCLFLCLVHSSLYPHCDSNVFVSLNVRLFLSSCWESLGTEFCR